MSRWIDAEELMRLLQNYRPFVESGRFNELQIQANQLVDCIEYEIEDAPSIDLVRCGECKHWKQVGNVMGNCRKRFIATPMKYNDFCSYGCRKESE